MNLAARGTHNVLDADSTHQQCISNERAMTAPRHRFGAHQDDLFLVRVADQFLEALRKLRRLHIIRITPKGSVPPAPVERITFRMAQSTQSRLMNVA